MAKRVIIQKDIKMLVNRIRDDDFDDALSLSRRRELQGVAAALEDCAHNYAQHGKQHTYAMFGALTDAIAGIIGAIRDHAASGCEAKPPPVVEPPRAMHASMLPDVAATMTRLETRLNKTAADVADLIRHVQESRSRP